MQILMKCSIIMLHFIWVFQYLSLFPVYKGLKAGISVHFHINARVVLRDNQVIAYAMNRVENRVQYRRTNVL